MVKKISFILLSCLMFVFGLFLTNYRFATINEVYAENTIPYEFVYLSNWTSHTVDFSFSASGTRGLWSDGLNIYYSYGSGNQYVLDTLTLTWTAKTWSGLTPARGSYIWSDGINIFYSYSSNQYVLDISTSTWTAKTWSGLTNFSGEYVWSDGSNIYYSYGSGYQYVLDISTSTWTAKTWFGLSSPYGSSVWTDGVYFYHSGGVNQYVLDISTSTWTAKTWFGLTNFSGVQVWNDGLNIYYSNNSNQYVLDISTSTWTAKTWSGRSSFVGSDILSLPDIHIVLLPAGSVWYSLDREEIEPPDPPDPPDPDSDYIQGYIDGYYDAYNDALTSGFDTGYNLGYNYGFEYATNMLSGFGPFLYAQWSIVDRFDYSIIRDDLTGRFTTEYFDKYNGGFINNVDFVNLVYDYEENNSDDDNAMKIDFDNYLPLSQYNNVVTFNFLYGNELYFILDNGTSIHFDNDSVTKSISLDSSSNNSIVSIVITFASSISDYGYFGFGFNSNYMVSYNNGFNDGYEKGHAEGNASGYSLGKNKGYQEGLVDANKYSFLSLIGAVVDAPINAITGLFNFNILGVNILELLTGLLTLLVVLVVIKFFLGR